MCSFGSSQSYAPTYQTTGQTTTPSAQAQQMYMQAWQKAMDAAGRQFQPYSKDPRAFVAQLNQMQRQAMQNIGRYQGAASPYYKEAQKLASQASRTSAADLARRYMSPYMRQVVDPVKQALQQQQAQQLSEQQTEAIKGGAFGQERAGLQRSQLRGQQQLGMGQALSPLYQTGYGQALGAAQTDLARRLQGAEALGQLGTGYQQAGLAGAQALLGAGTLGQQTAQAGKQALYNQFLMQQQFPYMQSQFLTQAASGLGPGFGGTSTGYQQSYQPLSFWGNILSDPDLKTGAHEDDHPEVIGETKDGQKIYRYRLINPETGELGPAQIGLMADEVEERNPDAVGDYKGFKTVDYAAATDDAARMGGGVKAPGDYADGGGVYGADIGDILKSQQESYKGLGAASDALFKPQAIQSARIETPTLSYGKPPQQEKGSLAQGLESALGMYNTGKQAYGLGKEALGAVSGLGGLLSGAGAAGGTIGALGGAPLATVGGAGSLAVPTFGAAAPAAASGLAGIGSAIMSAVPYLATLFSDPKLKTGVRPQFADGGAGGYSDEDISQFLGSLGGIETGGEKDPYSIVGPHTKYGDPIGKYQVLETNIPKWSKEAGLGRLSKEDFLGNKEAQEAVARHRFGKYLSETGNPEEAAAMWFAGPGYKSHMGAKDVLGTSIPEYQEKFRRGLGQSGSGENFDLSNLPPGAREFMATTEKPSGGLGAAVESTPQPEGISGFLRGTAPEGVGEKAADFATSEKFIVPLLTGLGAMASSGSRFLAPSILQGLGAGAKAYMEVPKIQAETEKIAQEAKTQAQETLAKKALTGKIGVETQRLATELYEKQWIPNVGWVVYDKSKPYSTPRRITDAEGNALGSIVPKDVPTKAGTVVPEPTKNEPVVGSHLEWKPTLSAPQGTQIPGALNIALSGDLPKQQESAKKEIEGLRNRAQSAYDQQYRLDEMEKQFRNLPERGILQPGAYSALRTQLAKDANTAVTALGGKPLFDPSDVAAAEQLAKDTTRLGFDVSKALGHEPGFIVQSAVAANPGMENTAVGFQRITAGLKEATKYEQDRLAFFEDYAARFGTIVGADKLFRQLNPPQAYARRAVLSTVDPEDMQYLRSVPKDQILKNEAEIDRKYGRGITKMLLGEE